MSASGPQVLKFGGSSLARMDQIANLATSLVRCQQEGQQLVVVVSARGRQTDRLRRLASALSRRPPARELDLLLSSGEQVSAALLSMAIEEAGGRARALTAALAGIVTDDSFGQASVQRVSTALLRGLLAEQILPVVAGFQGVTTGGEITTLGRGGSDTTAVALAAALGWRCVICTDVSGVHSADPRRVNDVVWRQEVRYDEMVELSRFGAEVLHHRAAEMALEERVPLVIRHSCEIGNETRLVERLSAAEPAVTSVAASSGQVSLIGSGAAANPIRDLLAGVCRDHRFELLHEARGKRRLTLSLGETEVGRLLPILHRRLKRSGFLHGKPGKGVFRRGQAGRD